MRKLRKIDGGPCRDTSELIATTKRRLRRGDVRAMAIVLVDGQGNVATAYAGHKAGHFHTLASGIAGLGHRYHSER